MTDLFIFLSPLAFLAFILVLAYIFGPITYERDISSNARNNPFRIILGTRIAKSPFRAAIWAQEYAENRYKLTHPKALFRRPEALRVMEAYGHEVEVQAAFMLGAIEKEGIEMYRRKEARALAGYKQFKGWSVEIIENMMEEQTREALKFATKHFAKIKKYDVA